MPIVRTTVKGQVVIPADLRKKHKIKKGSKVLVYEGEGDTIVLKPVPDDPVGASKGMLKGKTSLLQALIRERKEEAKRG